MSASSSPTCRWSRTGWWCGSTTSAAPPNNTFSGHCCAIPCQATIKEGKYAFRLTRLSCRKFRDNEVRLQLHALTYNLAAFLRCIELPKAMADWSLTSLQLKLIKIGPRVVRHAGAITFQLAEVAVTGPMVRAILTAIRRLRAPPPCA